MNLFSACNTANSFTVQTNGDMVVMARVKLLNIVGSTLLLLRPTSLFFFIEAEINNMLSQQRWTI